MNLSSGDRFWLDLFWNYRVPLKVVVYETNYDEVWYLTLYFNTNDISRADDICTISPLFHKRGHVFIPYCSWYLQRRLGYVETPQRGGYLL